MKATNDVWSLAEDIASVLRDAGFLVWSTELGSGLDLDPGVEIEIEQQGLGGDDSERYVFISWRCSSQVRHASADAVDVGVFDAPAIAFAGAVGEAMEEALRRILEACGYETTPGGDLRPFTVCVVAPKPDLPPELRPPT